jgi:hypothetical protein
MAVDRAYPSDPADAGRDLFVGWLGAFYARSTSIASFESADGLGTGEIVVGRKHSLSVAVLDTLSNSTTLPFEAARAAIERRLDDAGQRVAVWAPRGAPLPAEEPALSAFMIALEEAAPLEDARLEVRRPCTLYLRRTSNTGSVVTVLGGLAGHWAQFTNKVPGSFQLNSADLFRLPASEDERLELANRIVNAAAQPEVDEGMQIAATDTWTANRLESARSYVLGTPAVESDETSAELRREMRRLLKAAEPVARSNGDARALVVLGASTYADDEKLSWVLRGMDPRLYSGFDIITVVTDGLVKVVLAPPRGTLPWDAPLS